MSVDPVNDPLHEAALMEQCSFRVTDDKIARALRGEFEGVPTAWRINYSAVREPVFEPKVGNPRAAFESRNEFISKSIETCKKIAPSQAMSDKQFREVMADIDALVKMRMATISNRRMGAWHAREFSCLARLAKLTLAAHWMRVTMTLEALLSRAGVRQQDSEIKGHRATS